MWSNPINACAGKGRVLLLLSLLPGLPSCKSPKTPPVDVVVERPDFAQHIAPILYQRCAPCHRPQSAGPFPLLTYDDVRRKLKTIRQVVSDGLMPPWPADTSYSRFRDEKIIRPSEKELLLRWIDQGAAPGNLAALPPPPEFPAYSHLGTPALTVRMDTFFIPGNNQDHFMMAAVPYTLPSDTFVSAIEILPGNARLVHHINAHLVQYNTGRKRQFRPTTPVNTEKHDKREAYELLDLPNDDGSYPLLTPSVSNYLPGVISSLYPPGIGGYRVRKQGVLLLDNLHYGPSPVDTFDCTTFNFFFSAVPPSRPVKEIILGTSGISPVVPPLVIPPGTVSKFRTQYMLSEDLSLVTINPHMHLLGVSFFAYAVKPTGDTVPLIRINRWDFRWQYFYTFRNMLPLPRGTTIFVEGVFDNTPNNPLNPFDPPQQVSEREGSMRTTDEMFQLIISCTPSYPGDEYVSLEMKEKL